MKKGCDKMETAQQLIDSAEVFLNDYEIADRNLSIIARNQN